MVVRAPKLELEVMAGVWKGCLRRKEDGDVKGRKFDLGYGDD